MDLGALSKADDRVRDAEGWLREEKRKDGEGKREKKEEGRASRRKRVAACALGLSSGGRKIVSKIMTGATLESSYSVGVRHLTGSKMTPSRGHFIQFEGHNVENGEIARLSV